jgi:hypothetical protein
MHVQTGGEQLALFKALLEEVHTGLSIPSILRRFEMFSSATADGITWPLCYTSCILGLVKFDYPEATAIIHAISRLGSDASRVGAGVEWEDIIQIALIMACLRAKHLRTRLPFNLTTSAPLASFLFIQMPARIDSIKKAYKFMKETLKGCSAYPALLLATPSHAGFPLFDGFCVLQTSSSTPICVTGFQAKAGRKYPTKDIPKSYVHAGFLIRGKAPSTSSGRHRKGWSYLTSVEIADLLGASLGALYPANLPT